MNKKKSCLMVLAFCITTALTLAGCGRDQASFTIGETGLEKIRVNGFEIPFFPSPEGQLNYAGSWFRSMDEKEAALNAVKMFYPKAGIQCGEADLSLAYMKLGFDYRFTDEEKCRKSVLAYEKVAQSYRDFPVIVVKACWYLGWIYCDLLGEKQPGLDYFWRVADNYPEFTMGISPPVPWISLVYPVRRKDDQPVNDESQKQWASLALLEIVRHSSDESVKRKAFCILWERYRNSISTGLAMNILLDHHSLSGEVLPLAGNYLELNVANDFLAGEIRRKTGGPEF